MPAFATGMGAKPTLCGRKRNDRFRGETVESSRSPRIVPADLFRPFTLVEIRHECARSGLSKCADATPSQ
jgi:hypothetical protein